MTFWSVSQGQWGNLLTWTWLTFLCSWCPVIMYSTQGFLISNVSFQILLNQNHKKAVGLIHHFVILTVPVTFKSCFHLEGSLLCFTDFSSKAARNESLKIPRFTMKDFVLKINWAYSTVSSPACCFAFVLILGYY